MSSLSILVQPLSEAVGLMGLESRAIQQVFLLTFLKPLVVNIVFLTVIHLVLNKMKLRKRGQ